MSAYAVENLPRRWFTGAEHTKILYEIGKKVRESACSAVFPGPFSFLLMLSGPEGADQFNKVFSGFA